MTWEFCTHSSEGCSFNLMFLYFIVARPKRSNRNSWMNVVESMLAKCWVTTEYICIGTNSTINTHRSQFERLLICTIYVGREGDSKLITHLWTEKVGCKRREGEKPMSVAPQVIYRIWQMKTKNGTQAEFATINFNYHLWTDEPGSWLKCTRNFTTLVLIWVSELVSRVKNANTVAEPSASFLTLSVFCRVPK